MQLRVDGHGDQPRPPAREQRFEVRRMVARDDRDAVAAREARRAHRRGLPRDARGERRVVVQRRARLRRSRARRPQARAAREQRGDVVRRRAQYVARPPDRSNTAPVENEQSSLASQHTSAAISSTSPKRPIGIFDSMKSMCCCVIWSKIARAHRRRRHAVDADAGLRELLADRLGEPDHARPSTRCRPTRSGCLPCRRSTRC